MNKYKIVVDKNTKKNKRKNKKKQKKIKNIFQKNKF